MNDDIYMSVGHVTTQTPEGWVIKHNSETVQLRPDEAVVYGTFQFGKPTTWVLEKLKSKYPVFNQDVLKKYINFFTSKNLLIGFDGENQNKIFPIRKGDVIKKNTKEVVMRGIWGEVKIYPINLAVWYFADGSKNLPEIAELIKKENVKSEYTFQKLVNDSVFALFRLGLVDIELERQSSELQ